MEESEYPSEEDILRTYLDRGVRNILTVPCSITDTWHQAASAMARGGGVDVVATNHEGNLAGMAAGIYFATGRPALIHFQNSGLCNAGDGLMTFAHPRMFAIPMAVLITERGMSAADESEPHQEIGRRTRELVATIFGAEVCIESGHHGPGVLPAVTRSVEAARSGGLGVLTLSPDAFRRRRALTLPSGFRGLAGDCLDTLSRSKGEGGTLPALHFPSPPSRDGAILAILDAHPGAAVLFGNGFTSRAAKALRDRDGNFYNIGYMGGTMAIGWALARHCPGLEVVVVDGDQNALMSGMKDQLMADYPSNLHWYILNNHIGASVGVAESIPLSPLYRALAHVIETLPDAPGTFNHPRVKAPGTAGAPLAGLARRFHAWVSARAGKDSGLSTVQATEERNRDERQPFVQ